MDKSLGFAECVGFTTAMAFADGATKAANVEVLGIERVIGVAKAVSVVVKIQGEVAAVQAALDAGVAAAEKVGKVVYQNIIARPGKGLEKLVLSSETQKSLIKSKSSSKKEKQNKS